MNRTRIVVSAFLSLLFVSQVMADELIRRRGQHIDLTTDLANAKEAETLVASFDAAVDQWRRFWNLPADALAGWRVRAYVMRNEALFREQGMIPDHIPQFPFGYAFGNTIWVRAQQSEYYTRHLLLHEGVHSLAFEQFDGAGPTWFMEGTAELLSTHQGSGATTIINHVPVNREEVPFWGRFKLMEQLRRKDRVPTIETVMRYSPTLTGNVETYGWSWAAAMILHAYLEYHNAFFAAARDGSDGPQFNRRLFQKIGQKRWPVLVARWRLMCRDLDYGFNWDHERVALSVDDPAWNGKPLITQVQADQGWQSSAVRFEPGTKISINASGRVVLDNQPKPWISEPAGITIQYARGRPLGQLLACIVPNARDRTPMLKPLKTVAIESQTTLDIDQHCWIVFRVNDHLGAIGNNSGQYAVTVKKAN